MDTQERLEATPEGLALEAIALVEQLRREQLKTQMRVAMLERAFDTRKDFNRVVEEKLMVLRDLLPHATTLIDVVKAWKMLGGFPGDQLGAVTFGWIAMVVVALLITKLNWLITTAS